MYMVLNRLGVGVSYQAGWHIAVEERSGSGQMRMTKLPRALEERAEAKMLGRIGSSADVGAPSLVEG